MMPLAATAGCCTDLFRGGGGILWPDFLLFLYPSYIWEEAVAELGISHLIGILPPTNWKEGRWKKVTRAR